MSEHINPNHINSQANEGIIPAPEQVPLPEGYVFTDPQTITPREFADLNNQVEIGKGSTEKYLPYRAQVYGEMGFSVIDVGVRTAEGELIGFGSVVSKEDYGRLADFVVSPQHQGRGIGKSIITKRMIEAEAAGITSFHMPALESTNHLKSYYLELGFTETPEGDLVRGPNPVPLG